MTGGCAVIVGVSTVGFSGGDGDVGSGGIVGGDGDAGGAVSGMPHPTRTSKQITAEIAINLFISHNRSSERDGCQWPKRGCPPAVRNTITTIEREVGLLWGE